MIDYSIGDLCLCEGTNSQNLHCPVGDQGAPVIPNRRAPPSRRKRQVTVPDSDNIDDVYYMFDYGGNDVPHNYTWPTPSGITKQSARQACEDVLTNSSSYTLCRDSIQEDINNMVDACTSDIQVLYIFIFIFIYFR